MDVPLSTPALHPECICCVPGPPRGAGEPENHGGCTLTVLLSVWMDVAGEMSIQLIPQYPVIRGSVTMSITGITGNIQSITWYKGPTSVTRNQIVVYITGPEPTIIKGASFHNRMTVAPDGSLMISNLNTPDERNYTAKIQTDKVDDIDIYLKIYEKVGKPKIRASPSNPKENDAVTLTCTSNNAERIVWSRVPSGATLSSDNKTISFSRINRSDAGDYSCTATNPASKENSDSFKITVAYGPENVTVKAQSLSASLVSLECSANSVPPPTYHWKLNGTDIKGKWNTLQVDQMKDEGTYTCVATNSVTRLTATNSIYVNATFELHDHDVSVLIGSVISVAVVILLVLVAVLAYLYVRRRRHMKQLSSTENASEAAVYENVIESRSHTNETPLPGIPVQATQEAHYEQLTHKDRAIYSTLPSKDRKY